VVAGTVYQVKIKCDNDEFVHAKIIQPLPHTGSPPSIMTCAGGKKDGDAFAF